MTRLLMVVLMLGGIGCGVDSGPTGSTLDPADPADHPTAETSAALSSSPDALDPAFVAQCRDGAICELTTACRAAGGRTGAPCAANATCCSFD